MRDQNLNRIIDIIRGYLYEEVPTNSLAGGKIAGTEEAGDNPPVRKRKRSRYIYLKGVRSLWKPENGGAN